MATVTPHQLLPTNYHLPLIVILGPTASGKSQLALDLAERYHGEIISADSRAVYSGLDIGTAKPTIRDRELVPHHLIDVAGPEDNFTLYDFQQRCKSSILDIISRGKLPILVGGTGLYVDSVLFDYQLTEQQVDHKKRALLEGKTPQELLMMLKDQRISPPKNITNKRHLIRALEQKGVNTVRSSIPVYPSIIVGIMTEKSVLQARIHERAVAMFEAGVVDEATAQSKVYGWESVAMSGSIYRVARRVADGELSVDEAIDIFVTLDWQLARRQMTWFRRNPYIKWLEHGSVMAYIEGELDRLRADFVLR